MRVAVILMLFLNACASAGVAIIKAGSVAVSGLEAANAIDTAGTREADPVKAARECAKLPKASADGAACRKKQHCTRTPKDPICVQESEPVAEAPVDNGEALKAAEEARAERERTMEQVRQEAKKLGLTVDFDTGLSMTISAMRSGEKKMPDVKKTAIHLNGDTGIVVMQVIDQNNVLFRDHSTDAIVWLKNYAKSGGEVTWIEGASLTILDMRYVAVRGTKEYKTVLGSKQAIVIEAVF